MRSRRETIPGRHPRRGRWVFPPRERVAVRCASVRRSAHRSPLRARAWGRPGVWLADPRSTTGCGLPAGSLHHSEDRSSRSSRCAGRPPLRIPSCPAILVGHDDPGKSSRLWVLTRRIRTRSGALVARVATRAPVERVVASVPVEQVRPSTTAQGVVAAGAGQHVMLPAAEQLVGGRSAAERVPPRSADQSVGASHPGQPIAPTGTGEDVRCAVPHEGVGEGRAERPLESRDLVGPLRPWTDPCRG